MIQFFKNIFGAKEVAPNANSASLSKKNISFDDFIRGDYTGDATRYSHGAAAKEGYGANYVVYSCVRLIATAALDTPLILVKNSGGNEGEVENKEIKAILERPNPFADGASFLEAIVSDLALGGNAYVERVKIGRRVRQLYRVQPDKVTLQKDSRGCPSYYTVTDQGNSRRFDVDPVTGECELGHIRLYDPKDPFSGASPLNAASRSLQQLGLSADWMVATLKNSACPSLVLTMPVSEGDYGANNSGYLTNDQKAELKKELEGFSGRGIKRPMLLEGGMDVKGVSMSPNDMQFDTSKNAAAREIALCLGVPPLLLGINGDNTFANYTEANKAFYRMTVLPYIKKYASFMSGFVLSGYADNLKLETYTDNLPVFADEMHSKWQRIVSADILTIDEKRTELGYEPIKGDGGDTLLVQSSLVPITNVSDSVVGLPADLEDEQSIPQEG